MMPFSFQEMNKFSEKTIHISKRVVPEGEYARYLEKYFKEFAIFADSEADVVVDAVLLRTREIMYLEKFSRLTEEAYRLCLQERGKKVIITVQFSSLRGLWYAVTAISDMLLTGVLPIGEIFDYPAFVRRGFLEGFYGKPWSVEQRKGMIDLMARHRMNTYFYAPKDDPYHRDRWEECYDSENLSALCDVLRFSAEKNMDFVYCLAPGLTICYSDIEQYAKIKDKLRQVFDAGVRHFGLFLDDIPSELQYEADKMKYKELVVAHIDIIRRIWNDLKGWDHAASLTICPKEYHGQGNEYYISRMGMELPAEIDIFWTGSNICSQTLDAEGAMRFSASTFHQPLFWDNYPVNDAEMFHEMHLGPLTGRDPALSVHCRGLMFNGMEFYECTKVAYLTAAAFLWNPLQYDPELAWMAALHELLGPDVSRFILFAEQLQTSCLRQPNGPRMMAILSRVAFALKTSHRNEAIEMLEEFTAELRKTRSFLTESSEPMILELKKWITKFNVCCDIIDLALELLRGDTQKSWIQLAEAMQFYNDIATILTEFGFREFMDKLYEMFSHEDTDLSYKKGVSYG
ncbi:MAG: beta-N-acetylglucosaminidase domain-containing protein [Oscillospiraceae bacterium]|jgi:hyaluronoglucosaminidase|nr:beta-N-acetylglucosaminidase domain-containing protein [Oscillospiraceae bacterium]